MANIQRSPKLWREQEQFSGIGSNMTTLIVITALILVSLTSYFNAKKSFQFNFSFNVYEKKIDMISIRKTF